MKDKIIQVARGIALIIFLLAMLDAWILLTALGQIAMEGRTGYWSPFWRTQAEWVLNLQQKLDE